MPSAAPPARSYPRPIALGASRDRPQATTRASEGNAKMPTGTVKFFNDNKGFGFISPEGGGPDSFVHISDVERSGMSTLREGQRVTYDVEDDQRGKQKATNLKAAE
jgi:CspA family cold shock protein